MGLFAANQPFGEAFWALQRRYSSNATISRESIHHLFDTSSICDGEAEGRKKNTFSDTPSDDALFQALVALDASQLVEHWPSSAVSGVEAAAVHVRDSKPHRL